jgi:hypothetical protein
MPDLDCAPLTKEQRIDLLRWIVSKSDTQLDQWGFCKSDAQNELIELGEQPNG